MQISPALSRLTNRNGILLVGHGTRDAIGTQDFLHLAQQLADYLPQAKVEPAFLELQQPTILAGLKALLERGTQELVIAPLLLFAAGHAKADVPDAVRQALQELGKPQFLWRQTSHLGCHPQLVQLSCCRIFQALSTPFPSLPTAGLAAPKTCLLMVGRGSKDPSATAEMHRFAQLVAARVGAHQTEVAFVAMASPSLKETITRLLAANYERVMVVPHLLFQGDLLGQIQTAVAAAQAIAPAQKWHLAGILGHDLGTRGRASEVLPPLLAELCVLASSAT